MNGLQIFAFVALPVAVAFFGWIVALVVAPIKRASEERERSMSEADRQHA